MYADGRTSGRRLCAGCRRDIADQCRAIIVRGSAVGAAATGAAYAMTSEDGGNAGIASRDAPSSLALDMPVTLEPSTHHIRIYPSVYDLLGLLHYIGMACRDDGIRR